MRIGIDEAGRGSLLGPMIVAGVVLDDKAVNSLKVAGVKDSKKLSRGKREKLFNIILQQAAAISIISVEPKDIDRENLNILTYNAIIKIISMLLPLNPDKVSIDRVGDEKIVEDFLRNLNLSYEIIPNADEYLIEVSAASIIAKVVRDWIMDELRSIYGDFGSGYPSDERTIKWILEIYKSNMENPPPIIRRTWKILKRITPKFYIEKGV
jgi:ribonuclease HII